MKMFISALVLLLSFSLSHAQEFYWVEKKITEIPNYENRYAIPEKYRVVQIDVNRLRTILSSAPMEFTNVRAEARLILQLPMPDGSISRFNIVESPMMEAGLAAEFPDFKTYGGQGIDDPHSIIKISITRFGFHSMILSPKGSFFIDPFEQNNVSDYIIYDKKDFKARSFICDVADDDSHFRGYIYNPSVNKSHGTQLRTYRLALAATVEYTAFHGGTVASAMAAIVTTMNRVNGVYENEVAVRMTLIANNSSVVYTTAPDPYTNNSGSTMLGENNTNLNATIGSANYDIGHVFSTGGGGVATLNGPCGSNKARGVTGSSSPVGDGFDIDYVAHEMGHQFGAPHTFNATTSNCGGGNRSATSAYEPGSGITIMAYAGICGVNDLAPHSIAYFHTKSFDDITTFITNGSTGGSCPVTTNTGNTPPVAAIGLDYSIPISTPFVLTGSGTDADNDPLVYSWEEFDLGNAGDWNAAQSSGNDAPLFRPFEPVTSPSRTFPKLSDIINNTTTIGEILPTVARTLDFRLTVRDNRAGGGGVWHNDITKKVFTIPTAGPFLVTAPNTAAVSWGTSSSQNVTWNVASTDLSPISCSNVNILLSTDGGNTFPITLSSNTANDGTETITVPANVTTQARVKIESVGNIFFDMSNANFSIVAASPVLTTIVTTPLGAANFCAGTNLSVSYTGDGPANAGNIFTAQLSNSTGSFASPVSIGILSSTASGTISCTIPGGTAAGTGYRIRVVSSNPLIIGSDNGSNLSIFQSVANAGTITGLATVCQGQTGVTYSIASLANATTYNWTLPSNATIATGSGTPNITVNYGATSTSGSVSVAGSNAGCGNGAFSLKPITVNTLPAAAGTITGTSSPCAGNGGYIYSIPVSSGATKYGWVLPSGASITSGDSTNSITVSFSAGALSGNIIVTPINSCGSGTASSPFSVVIYQPPTPVTISAGGATTVCSPSSVGLSFTPQTGYSYQWRRNGINLTAADTSSTYNATQTGTYTVANNSLPVSQQTFNSSGTVTILDNSCSTPSSNIVVSGYTSNVPSSQISINLNISHSWVGDLVMILEAPNGQRLGLVNRLNGGSNNGDNFVNTTFTDAGATMNVVNGAPYNGSFKPWSTTFTVCTSITTTLTTFAGFGGGSINPNGQWRLRVFDVAGSDDGTINNWSITFPAFSNSCVGVSNTIPVTIQPLTSINGFSPSSAAVGSTVTISGSGFSTATSVKFNGVNASFSIVSDTVIQATVPVGATSGTISVTNTCNTATSASAFNVVNFATLNLGVYIEGLYQPGGIMTQAIPGYADSVIVDLIPSSNLNVVAFTSIGLLNQSGLASVTFPGTVIGNVYYIAVRHRNSLATWSKVAVPFGSTTSYNLRF